MSALRNPTALLKAVLMRIPLLFRTLLFHGLNMSPVSGKQDLRTEMTVTIIRSLLDASLPVGKQQHRSMNDPGIKGPMWISKVVLPAPEETIRTAVIQTADQLKNDESQTFEIPPVVPVEAEWTGYRGGVDKNAPQLDISEEKKYQALKADAKSDMVILYIHGGALYLMDPCTHRVPVSHICKLTGARALSVRYRLAPQNPFPAALVDVLTAYLSLIHPPPGSYHEPVPANKIIISGDSAGGNLSLALLQTLLTLKKTAPTVQFHGKEVPIELPAGVALISPWCDVTRSMPSVSGNSKYDYIMPPHQPAETIYHPPPHTPDDVWPRTPPRSDMYCNASMVSHPLVSPLACPKELWQGSPPVFVTVGEEGLTDEGLLTARKIHQANVPVIVDEFEGMPHCFGLIMLGTTAGKLCFQSWARFCRDAVAGAVDPARGDVGYVTFHNFGWHSTKLIALNEIHAFSDLDIEKRLEQSRDQRIRTENRLLEEWQVKAKL
ncbi:putative lipase/esterase [Talaromyces proteolyticus]|uniref:Lipase/esterase n=1 Tax=Talaromyces proteolyticus TaxID=1131652 RepID=A0AAD4KPF9_9EURO|nr:putative lipase/esterase [Talaromyces proteolyticus]KAH8692634.1 putative lipase/esterase [Talaromyces proteolyticus]